MTGRIGFEEKQPATRYVVLLFISVISRITALALRQTRAVDERISLREEKNVATRQERATILTSIKKRLTRVFFAASRRTPISMCNENIARNEITWRNCTMRSCTPKNHLVISAKYQKLTQFSRKIIQFCCHC